MKATTLNKRKHGLKNLPSLTSKTSRVAAIAIALATSNSSPVSAKTIELRCVLNPEQFDTKEPLAEHLYTLNPDDSTVIFRTTTSKITEKHSAFYAKEQSTNTISVVSWMEMPGEIINLVRLVYAGNNTWNYQLGDAGIPEERIHLANWGTCSSEF